MFKKIKKRMFCLHDYVIADSYEDPYLHIRYSVGARIMWVCKKCGKVSFYSNY